MTYRDRITSLFLNPRQIFKFSLSFLLLFQVSLVAYGQTRSESFPNDFLGVYKGSLEINNADKPTLNIPMEFHLLATDSTHRLEYRLIYDGQPRNYTLIVNDLENGDLSIDENNGIILPAKLIGNVLHSFFEVQGNLLSSRIAFFQDHVQFEILFSNLSSKVRTGENTAYEIYGYPITTVQKAVLNKAP